MHWFPLALATAFFTATEAALLKRFFSDRSPWELTAAPFPYLLPLFGATVLLLPPLEAAPGFWPLLAGYLPLNVLALILHFRAIHLSQLSLVMPFLSLTPIFVCLTGFLFLGEVPSGLGALGIALTVAGGWVLARDPADRTLLGPLRALARDQGALCMLAAAVCYALNSVLGKMLILRSSPLHAANVFFLVFTVTVLALGEASGRAKIRTALERPVQGALVALFIYLHIQCHHLALAQVDTAYMMAIKRTAGLFSVFYGWLFFREANIPSRLAGAAIISAGAALIAFQG
jgi:drug/metabolite transporter (DMT)-like permease